MKTALTTNENADDSDSFNSRLFVPGKPGEPFSCSETEEGQTRGRDLPASAWLAWEVGSDSLPFLCSNPTNGRAGTMTDINLRV